MQFRKHTLENGLTIVAECNPNAYSTACAFFVNSGSRDETPDVSGVSHFLEHMVFKGTARRTAADVNRELDEIGSQSNAFTSEEQTVYYAAVLPEYQERTIDLLADILRPSLREEDFETEKQVIIEEIHKYDDQPPFGAYEKAMSLYFGDHPLGNNILGSVESVSALTPNAMRRYFEQRYSPSNIVVASAGNIDFDKLIRDVEHRCGEWQSFAAHRESPPAEGHAGVAWIERENAGQQYVVRVSGSAAAEDPDRYAARLLATIFGDDSGSRLFWALVDTGLADYAVTASYEFQGAGICITSMCCQPDDCERVVSEMTRLQQELQQHGVTDDELELAKSKICSQVVRRAERPANRMFSIGNNWIQHQQYRTVRETVAAYQRVTLADIQRVLERFPYASCATIFAGPLQQASSSVST